MIANIEFFNIVRHILLNMTFILKYFLMNVVLSSLSGHAKDYVSCLLLKFAKSLFFRY